MASLMLGALSKTIGKLHFEDGARGFFCTVQETGTERRWEEGMAETWKTLHLQLLSEHGAEGTGQLGCLLPWARARGDLADIWRKAGPSALVDLHHSDDRHEDRGASSTICK